MRRVSSSPGVLAAALLLLTTTHCGQRQDPCTPGEPTASAPALPTPQGFLPYGHSHNDYEKPRPVDTALDARLYSLEVDVWMLDGQLRVGHWPWSLSGTLESLYLAPLQARVDRNGGSVHGDGERTWLWLDIKNPHPLLPARVRQALQGWNMLEVTGGPGARRGAVTVVLTGNTEMKQAVMDGWSSPRAVRDANDFSPDDPATDGAWTHYALSWPDFFAWDGSGTPPEEDSRALGCIINSAHRRGIRVRFFGGPDTEDTWRWLLDHGVDHVGTDQPGALGNFLAGRERR